MRDVDPGERAAADRTFALLYHELHRLAEHHLRRGVPPVGATTLLHEAYLNVAGRPGVDVSDRSRFLAYASRVMRGLVIDFARRRRAVKRGSGLEVTLSGDELPAADAARTTAELEQLGDALEELAVHAPALAELVDLHFFCGLTFAEIAAIRAVSERTVRRDWRKARLLLHRTLLDDEEWNAP